MPPNPIADKDSAKAESRLAEDKVKLLVSKIKDSFRVRRNHDPEYVDFADNIDRIGAGQHQIVFGRRGSGKSCLFVHFLNKLKPRGTVAIYIMSDEFKQLTYPDILIRLLVELMENTPDTRNFLAKICFRPRAAKKHAKELRELLHKAEHVEVTEGAHSKLNRDSKIGAGAKGLEATFGDTREVGSTRTSQFKEEKIDMLERRLKDYKEVLVNSGPEDGGNAYVMVDDFYLFPRDRQPFVLDYLHRLLRDTQYYLKVATIRHRTQLNKKKPHTIGVELSQDVEEISLDRTLEDLDGTQTFLRSMLASLAFDVGITDITEYFNSDAHQALVLSSGGVPRDYLSIFNFAVENAIDSGKTRWLTPTDVYKGAGRLAYQSKLRHLRDDASSDASGLERVFTDLLAFCLKEKKKTAFLVSQDEARKMAREHDWIQQLMDFKLIHVVELDTSAASGRAGRYEAYTLDFSLFMEPRLRGIEIVRFWEVDDQRRKKGIREAPTYSLDRAAKIFDDDNSSSSPDALLAELDEQIDDEADDDTQQQLF